LLVSNTPLELLINTGASVSNIQSSESPGLKPTEKINNAAEFGGNIIPHAVSEPTHSQAPLPWNKENAFVLSPTSSVNLLGMDLLCKLGVTTY